MSFCGTRVAGRCGEQLGTELGLLEIRRARRSPTGTRAVPVTCGECRALDVLWAACGPQASWPSASAFPTIWKVGIVTAWAGLALVSLLVAKVSSNDTERQLVHTLAHAIVFIAHAILFIVSICCLWNFGGGIYFSLSSRTARLVNKARPAQAVTGMSYITFILCYIQPWLYNVKSGVYSVLCNISTT